jgi:hypothetical protein
MSLMTMNRETSYKEPGNSVTFHALEYSNLALCIISCVHTNSELYVTVTCLSSVA